MARSNKIVVPDAKQSLDSFKMEVANSLNVNLKQGYNGDKKKKTHLRFVLKRLQNINTLAKYRKATNEAAQRRKNHEGIGFR